MKRILTCSVFLILATLPSFAQKRLPAFGKIDKADLLLTDCAFDKGADAIKLIDWGSLHYDRGTVGISTFKTIFEKRVRIKILKEKGLSQGNVTIPFYDHNGEERILHISGYVYTLDNAGNIQTTELKKNSIYTKKINAYHSEMIIAFPELKVGSVIEYRYTIDRETVIIKDWSFQDNIPTRYSEYEINIPAAFRFTVQPMVMDSIEVKEKMEDGIIGLNEGVLSIQVLHKNFIMRDLIGIRNEPFMGSIKDYQQRLEFQLSQIDYGNGEVRDLRVKWGDVIEELKKSENFGLELKRSVPGTEDIVATANALSGNEDKVRYIFNAVRNVMNCNDGEAIYSDKGIRKAWKEKEGNAADINLLLIKLLNDAGIKAMPILLSTRDNGLVNSYYPFIAQFNIVMALVRLNDKDLVLDATDKISDLKLTPEKIVNTNGLVIEGKDGRWISVIDVKHTYKVMSATKGSIDPEAVLKAESFVNCKDYARKQRVEVWHKDKEKFKRDYFSLPGMSCNIEELIINNVDVDSLQLEQKVRFTSKLNSSGDYSYFNINIFSNIDKNPFIQDERISDIDFGFKQDYTLFGSYSIPDGFTFDVLPENISMIMPDTSIIFTRYIQADGNLLNVRVSLEFQRTYYPAANYLEFKEFYKKLFNALNEQVVIKKKA